VSSLYVGPIRKVFRSALMLALTVLAGCKTVQPVIFKDLDSAPLLTPDTRDPSGHVPFAYQAPAIDLATYHGVIFEPVSIYSGSDHQFGKLSIDDRKVLAAYTQKQFAAVLSQRYVMTSLPGPNTLKVLVTLTGAEKTVPVLGTLKQITPVGAAVGLVRSARDKQAHSIGSVTYAVEIYDSSSGRILRALIVTEYPAAENLSASIGALTAAEVGIQKGSQSLLDEMK